ncbi:hypothetical protein [Chromobacterium alticapitis]|uniref:Uncharacterized protein n=1 Tax=Chromobacterium alticapitis TaxID=2073169 RepID=A0A2S5DG33_9NEIS|nr:hypothetical protein [Chromobacterium alticapitis]POZ62014.1 hypothetical protein C2I19_10710 [Chromobacterium alticapitis]
MDKLATAQASGDPLLQSLQRGWKHYAAYVSQMSWKRLWLTALPLQMLGALLQVPALTLALILTSIVVRLQGSNKQEATHE